MSHSQHSTTLIGVSVGPRTVRIVSKIYVLAGNAHQAKLWAEARGLSPRQWGYLGSPETCRGLRDIIVVKVGTFYTRKELEGVYEALAPANAVFVDEEVGLTNGDEMIEGFVSAIRSEPYAREVRQ